MSQYNEQDFSDLIRRMNDGGLQRLEELEKDEDRALESMRPGDEYFSTIVGRPHTTGYREVLSEVTKRAFIVDNVSDIVMQQAELAPPLAGLLSGMMLALADTHDHRLQAGASPLNLNLARTAEIAHDNWLLSSFGRAERQDVPFYGLALGGLAVTSVLLHYDVASATWQLGYERSHRLVSVGPQPDVEGQELIELGLVFEEN